MSIEISLRRKEGAIGVHFPEIREQQHMWGNWARGKVGEENLVAAIEYGSHVTGDATATSIRDFILIAKDTEMFHKRNIVLCPEDYPRPRSATVQTLFNRGPSYYRTEIPQFDGESAKAKYAVISLDNFIKGCHGTLAKKDREEPGGFGLSIAGRMQKVALNPIHLPEDDGTRMRLEESIHHARVDGAKLALGSLGENFSLDEMLKSYVSLSYRADVRPEKKGKAHILLEHSREEYADMMNPILADFCDVGILKEGEEGWEKLSAISEKDYGKRMRRLKLQTFGRNFKPVLTFGPVESVIYAGEKLKRANHSKAEF
jgi:hypothetical protein